MRQTRQTSKSQLNHSSIHARLVPPPTFCHFYLFPSFSCLEPLPKKDKKNRSTELGPENLISRKNVMTITTLPASAPSTNDADLAVLSVSRLLTRLEHNLLSPGADLVGLRKSEFQRMRVGANIEYAHSNLHSLERNIPATKSLDRKHTLQTEVQRHRETLKRLQALLEEISAEAEVRASSPGQAGYEDNEDEESVDGEDLLGTPEESSTENEPGREEEEEEEGQGHEQARESKVEIGGEGETKSPALAPPTATATPTTTATTSAPTATATLRNRHATSPSSPKSNAKATGSDHLSSSSPVATSKGDETEQTLSTHRAEQEDITSSLLSLASQLKASSQAFQTSLDSEKSVLARAVDGLDRTTGNMQAAERRMGMLRRMTEGKGWWGRMMLYAWILGLWVVAVMIVFLGPKLRF
ncbi:uncharacterized protein KD926_010233 [Aspergillus affinis]|uniref:uncharacterized protein n=1 Tax=Aspergillus affinis TaxID=1070780 RepID=UPI0022FE169F|nr:uncharacterized protein KD926_010233 [Aspergillus affinis]KAI9038777.1 hypothetical protein KD926_010233 [Aspergillus affinis]